MSGIVSNLASIALYFGILVTATIGICVYLRGTTHRHATHHHA